MTPCSHLVAGVAVDHAEFEPETKQVTVSDGQAGHSQRSVPGSTPVLLQRGAAMHEINITGAQVLVALAAGFSLAGPLLWAFVRYWLFAP